MMDSNMELLWIKAFRAYMSQQDITYDLENWKMSEKKLKRVSSNGECKIKSDRQTYSYIILPESISPEYPLLLRTGKTAYNINFTFFKRLCVTQSESYTRELILHYSAKYQKGRLSKLKLISKDLTDPKKFLAPLPYWLSSGEEDLPVEGQRKGIITEVLEKIETEMKHSEILKKIADTACRYFKIILLDSKKHLGWVVQPDHQCAFFGDYSRKIKGPALEEQLSSYTEAFPPQFFYPLLAYLIYAVLEPFFQKPSTYWRTVAEKERILNTTPAFCVDADQFSTQQTEALFPFVHAFSQSCMQVFDHCSQKRPLSESVWSRLTAQRTPTFFIGATILPQAEALLRVHMPLSDDFDIKHIKPDTIHEFIALLIQRIMESANQKSRTWDDSQKIDTYVKIYGPSKHNALSKFGEQGCRHEMSPLACMINVCEAICDNCFEQLGSPSERCQKAHKKIENKLDKISDDLSKKVLEYCALWPKGYYGLFFLQESYVKKFYKLISTLSLVWEDPLYQRDLSDEKDPRIYAVFEAKKKIRKVAKRSACFLDCHELRLLEYQLEAKKYLKKHTSHADSHRITGLSYILAAVLYSKDLLANDFSTKFITQLFESMQASLVSACEGLCKLSDDQVIPEFCGFLEAQVLCADSCSIAGGVGTLNARCWYYPKKGGWLLVRSADYYAYFQQFLFNKYGTTLSYSQGAFQTRFLKANLAQWQRMDKNGYSRPDFRIKVALGEPPVSVIKLSIATLTQYGFHRDLLDSIAPPVQ